MKMKKLGALALTTTLVFGSVLTGCGGKDKGTTADGKKNLSVFIFANDHESPIYKGMIEKYKEAHSDTIGNIDVQITTQEEYSKTLTGMMTAKELPDVFYVGPESVQQFVENGYIENIQPILTELGISTDDLVAQEALNSYRYDGSKVGTGDLYALPKDASVSRMHTIKICLTRKAFLIPTRRILIHMTSSWRSASSLPRIQTVTARLTSGAAVWQISS